MKHLPKISLLTFSCIVSLGTLLLLNFMMTYLVMWLLRVVGRILLAILAIINATAVYFIYTYSVMIDATTIDNVFNTRYSEASGFFSWGLWLFILGAGVLPALWCLLQPVVIGRAKKLGIYCGSALAVALAVAAMNISQTLFISEHDTELGGLLQPWSYIVNICRNASLQHDEEAEEILLPDGKIADNEKAVVVLVIGESARKANFQLYGYKRDTNPLLSKQDSLKVYEATSCATYTTAGTKAILEPKDSGDLYELLPNYAFRMGVDVSWRTSNWGEPPIHIDEYINNTELAKAPTVLFRNLSTTTSSSGDCATASRPARRTRCSSFCTPARVTARSMLRSIPRSLRCTSPWRIVSRRARRTPAAS